MNQLHERSANERKTKNERTMHTTETNGKRKRYDIFVNLAIHDLLSILDGNRVYYIKQYC
jgi:hypothetical protein